MLNDAHTEFWLGGQDSTIEIKSDPGALRPRRSLGDRVRRALLALADNRAAIRSHQEKAWASITFSGSRHEVVLEFTGSDAVLAGESLIECLPDHEFAIPGHLVADAAIQTVEHLFGPEERLTITAVLLLLEEH
ncbi:MAG: hypothetical protein ACK4IB_09485 [Erythrobacter sp.]|jgi:hypothetical protein